MSTSNLIFSYVVLALGGVTGAAVFSELRRRSFEPAPSKDRIFRCRKCSYVYTDDPDVVRSRCSQCGQINDAMQF